LRISLPDLARHASADGVFGKDNEAPIIVCEIAIAADELYNSVLHEAALKRPDEYDAISDIKSKLIRYRNDNEEALNENRLANERLGLSAFPQKGAES
jgi:hypothetical protein